MKDLCFSKVLPILLLLLLLLKGPPACTTVTASFFLPPANNSRRATPAVATTTTTTTTTTTLVNTRSAVFPQSTRLFASASKNSKNNKDDDDDGYNDNNKFGFGQRIESIKCLVVGAIAGGVAVAPVCALHNLLVLPLLVEPMVTTNNVAQWELMNDLAALQAGLFAIVYRYCIRNDNASNPQLGQGVVGAFVLTRTLGSLIVPTYCTAIPLYCGGPLGYLDWTLLGQIGATGLESAVLFGATAAAMDYCMDRRLISRFPG